MNKHFFRLFIFLVIQLAVLSTASAQSSLVIPESVEAGEDFTISWRVWTHLDFDAYSDDDALNFEGDTNYKLQRYDSSSTQWITVYEVDVPIERITDGEEIPVRNYVPEPYLESLIEEGVYEYRLIRKVLSSENEDEGDSYNDDTITEPSISITVLDPAFIADAVGVLPLSYHFLDSRVDGDTPQVYGLVKDTTVFWNETTYQLDAGEFLDIGTVSQGDVIGSNKPLSIGSNRSGVDMPVPSEFAGTEFAIPLVRNTHIIHVKNNNNVGVDVEFFDGATRSIYSMRANEIARFESALNGLTATVKSVDQTSELLVSHRTDATTVNAGFNGAYDAYSVAPAALELFGVRTGSGRVGALFDDTTVFQYADNGAVFETVINAGDSIAVIGNAGSDGAASFVRITANKPIGAIQIGDSDGGEQTGFITQSFFAREFVLPTDTQYVAMGCIDSESTISIFDPAGVLLESTTCSSTADLPGKAFLGSVVDGTQFSAGSRIESTEPIYLIYENSITNDESNLAGSLLSYPHGYHFLSHRDEGDRPAVYGIANNTEVFWKGEVFNIDAGELLDIGVVSQGDAIESSHALAIGSNKDGTDMPVPVEFAGTRFAIPLARGTHYIYVKNTHNYEVEVYFSADGASDGSSIEAIGANEVVRLVSNANGEISATVESFDGVSKLLVSHVTSTNTDAYPVAPVAREIYGIRSGSGLVGAVEDATTITQTADTGTVVTSSIDAGGRLEVIGSGAASGRGSFLKLEADNAIAAIQYADSDGSESTAYIAETMFARLYVLPVDTQYIAMGCTESDVEISVYSPEGVLIDLTNCNANGETPGKAYLGDSVTSVSYEAGSRVEASKPVYLIYEASATNDEHNLVGERELPLDVRPSSFDDAFSVSYDGSHTFSWSRPQFDSEAFSLSQDNTVIQRLNENGDWITIDRSLYFSSIISSFREATLTINFAATEAESGFYQYRLLRNFLLTSTQPGPLLATTESYAEEPFHLLVLPSIELQGRGFTWPSLLTLPEESVGGSFTIVTEQDRSQYTHTNGVTYSVSGFNTIDLRVRTISGGPAVRFEGDGVSPVLEIENQPAGVYEYTATVGDAFVFFPEFYNFAVSQGFVSPGSGRQDIFSTTLDIADEAPTRITVSDDTRTATLSVDRTPRRFPTTFATTFSASHTLFWRSPEFDSDLYTLESDNTVLQELTSSGVWVTLDDTVGLEPVSSNLFRHEVNEAEPGFYQYRLRREFILAPINSSLPTIQEFYVEEPVIAHVLGSEPPINGFSSEDLSQFTAVDVPSVSADGNYKVSVFTGTLSLLHEDGRFYNVKLFENYLSARTLEGGPHVELQDGGDGIGSGVSIENQPPGVYTYNLSVDLLVFFEDEFNLAVSEGFITDTRNSRWQYFSDGGGFNGNTTHTITVDPNAVIAPEVRGPGSETEDSDGDGVNDAFDPYPLQNNTQCFP